MTKQKIPLGRLPEEKTSAPKRTLTLLKTARVRIYTFTQNNENYAMLVTNYPGTPVLIILVVPASEYEASQNWMVAIITGVRFR
jgi:hypothetical protein